MAFRSKKNMTVRDRKRQIILMFAIAIQNGDERWHTVYAIAKKLEITRSPHLMRIVQEMFDDGDLVRVAVNKKGRWSGYEYMLPEGSFIEPRKHRVVGINIKGKLAGQMELEI